MTKNALERARSIIRDSHSRSRITYDSAGKTKIGLLWGSGALFALAVVAVAAQSRSRDAFVPLPTNSEVRPCCLWLCSWARGRWGDA